MKKLLSTIMAVFMLCASLGAMGCNREQLEAGDDSKSLLNVGVFYAGYGIEWAKQAEHDFEKLYEDVVFEDGKKGVDVIIDAKKDEFKPSNLLVTMESYENAIYFLNQNDFYGFQRNGLLADITDTLNEKVYDADGYWAAASGKPAVSSMNDIMYAEFDGYYDINGRTYAAPWSFDCAGIIYDADLFDKNRYYFDDEGEIGCNQADIDAGNCGTGPDLTMGTPDDGMPVTWNDFVTLMDHMKRGGDNVTPFIWSGGTQYQKVRAYESIWANYEGYDDYMLNFSFNGVDAQLGQITPSTAGKLCEQEGIKAAIKAAYDIIDGGYYFGKSFQKSYTEAQTLYIDKDGEAGQVAMFMEGGYWEIEAIDTFDRMGSLLPSNGFGQRNFKRFPIPNFVGVEGITDQTSEIMEEPETLIGHSAYKNIALVTAKNKAKNPELQQRLAKLFLQYVNSREQLVNFTAKTGACIGAYHFKTTKEERNTFTKFGKNIFEYIENGSKVAIDVPLHEFRRSNYADWEDNGRGYFYINENGVGSFADPFTFFADASSKTVNDCWGYMQRQFKQLMSTCK